MKDAIPGTVETVASRPLPSVDVPNGPRAPRRRSGDEAVECLPEELDRFLQLPGPQSLVVRGRPGTGKSSLAFALLHRFAGERWLVSGRSSTDGLRASFPWLGAELAGESSLHVVSGLDRFEGPNATDLIAQAKSLLSADDTEQFARLLWLPQPIQDAWNQLPADQPAMIVVDSWDSLVDKYLPPMQERSDRAPGRRELEQFLFTLLSRSRAHLVVLLESEESGQLEYLSTASVTLGRELFDERWERTIRIDKVRGIEIHNASYPFTLFGARFRCLPPTPKPVGGSSLRWVCGDPSASGEIFPGSTDYDAAFGRLVRGRMTLVEVDPSIESETFALLAGPVGCAALERGTRVLLLPPPSFSFRRAWTHWRRVLPLATFQNQLRILMPNPDVALPPELRALVFALPESPATPGADRMPSVEEFMAHCPVDGVPNLVISTLSGTLSLGERSKMPFTPERLSRMFASFLETSPAHVLLFVRSGEPGLTPARDAAAVHLVARERRGRIVVYGARPPTPAYVLVRDATPPEPYRLVPLR